ncbi:MAG TPA: FAD-binding oxidoreductase [Acidimicrobiales bacterium]|nr:FAD-binding oxidoreductase [Acidimicrobiales bacterium]
MDDDLELVTGWGRNPVTASRVARPTSPDELTKAPLDAGPRGVVARGLGRAYGDAAMNAGGLVVDATGVSGVLDLDPASGIVRVLAGTSLDDLMRVTIPQGWFLPVTPGTKFVTVGGAIASDVHGKDHHAAGTFGTHVRSLVLGLSDGSTRVLTPESTPEEFWATCGGMGLTGTIVEATVALRPIETSRITVDTDRAPDLDSLLAQLAEGEERYRYSVAWIDLLARGRNLGRSVLYQGEFATVEQFAADGGKGDPLAFDPPKLLPAPPAPSGLLNRFTIRAFNELWFRKEPKRRRDELQTVTKFFYPLDMIDRWNRLYGSKGFLQWQCLVPFGEEDLLRSVVESISGSRTASFLAVLKRFGPANPGPLSFPASGWTVNLDIPAGDGALVELLARLDREIAGCGGRVYLAKDSVLHPELVPKMYPRLDEWRAVRNRLDPERHFVSDLARRLHLLG